MGSIDTKSATELYKVISLFSDEDRNKIPEEFIELIDSNKNDIEIDINNLGETTRRYLAYVYLNYILDENDKKIYMQILEQNEQRNQKKIKEKYDIDKIFAERNQVNTEEKSLAIVDNKKWYQKIFDKIKKLIHVTK